MITRTTLKNHLILIILCGIILAAIVTNVIWILRDQSPPLWDIAAHSARAVDVGHFIKEFHPRLIFNYNTNYPPVSYLVTGTAFLFFGYHDKIPQLSLLLYLPLLMLSVYGLGRKIFHNNTAALFATFLAITYPLLTHFSRIYDLDFQLTAFVASTIYCLVKTRGFTDWKWTVLFGLSFSLGLLTKWTFVVFLIGPVIAVFITEKVYQKSRRKNAWKPALITLALIAALTVPWYLKHGRGILASSEATRYNVFSVPFENIYSLGNIFYYPNKIITGLSWPLAAIAGLGLIVLIARRWKKEHWLLLSWIIVPYAIMTFYFLSKETRYLLPLYPALALASASVVAYVKARWMKASIMTSGVIVAMFFWLASAWNINLLPWDVNKQLGFFKVYGLFDPSTQEVGYGFTYPTQYQTNIREIPQAIADDVKIRGLSDTQQRIAVVPNSIFLTAAEIQYYGNLIGLNADYRLSSLIRSKDYQTFLDQADYILTKTGDQGPKVWAPSVLTDIQKAADSSSSEVFKNFEVIKTWRVSGIEARPQEVRLYRHKTGCNCNK